MVIAWFLYFLVITERLKFQQAFCKNWFIVLELNWFLGRLSSKCIYWGKMCCFLDMYSICKLRNKDLQERRAPESEVRGFVREDSGLSSVMWVGEISLCIIIEYSNSKYRTSCHLPKWGFAAVSPKVLGHLKDFLDFFL